jgi:hypothetical protein
MKIMQSDYNAEEINDIQDDIADALLQEVVQTDEWGLIIGKVRITVEYIPQGEQGEQDDN